MCQYANEIHMHSFLESAHWHIYHIGSLFFLPYDDLIHKDESLIRFISLQTDIAGFPVSLEEIFLERKFGIFIGDGGRDNSL